MKFIRVKYRGRRHSGRVVIAPSGDLTLIREPRFGKGKYTGEIDVSSSLGHDIPDNAFCQAATKAACELGLWLYGTKMGFHKMRHLCWHINRAEAWRAYLVGVA